MFTLKVLVNNIERNNTKFYELDVFLYSVRYPVVYKVFP